MDVTADLDAPCSADRLFTFVDDLGDYPAWMQLVHRVQPAAADAEGRPRWDVELRARIGPLARSKRLRMVRSVHDADGGRVVFERSEDDGGKHSPWVLDATVTPDGEASRLVMRLHYGGGLWSGGLLERALADQVAAGRQRLRDLVTAAPDQR